MPSGIELQEQHQLNSTSLGFRRLICPVKVASRVSDAFDSLLDAYARIGESLPVFAAVDTLFSNYGEHNVHQILANVYEDILKFHGRAVDFFKQRSMSRSCISNIY